jgi:hypothetical protein
MEKFAAVICHNSFFYNPFVLLRCATSICSSRYVAAGLCNYWRIRLSLTHRRLITLIDTLSVYTPQGCIKFAERADASKMVICARKDPFYKGSIVGRQPETGRQSVKFKVMLADQSRIEPVSQQLMSISKSTTSLDR